MSSSHSSWLRPLRHANWTLSLIAHCLFLLVSAVYGVHGIAPDTVIPALGISLLSAGVSLHTLRKARDIREWRKLDLCFILASDCVLLVALIIHIVGIYRRLAALEADDLRWIPIQWVIWASSGHFAFALQSMTLAGIVGISAYELMGRSTGRIVLDGNTEVATRTRNATLHSFLDRSEKVRTGVSEQHSQVDDITGAGPNKDLRSIIVWMCIATGFSLPVSQSQSAIILAPMLASMILCLGLCLPEVEAEYMEKRWLRIAVGAADAGVAVVYLVFLVDQNFELSTRMPANFGLIPICAFHIWLFLTTGSAAIGEHPDFEELRPEQVMYPHMIV